VTGRWKGARGPRWLRTFAQPTECRAVTSTVQGLRPRADALRTDNLRLARAPRLRNPIDKNLLGQHADDDVVSMRPQKLMTPAGRATVAALAGVFAAAGLAAPAAARQPTRAKIAYVSGRLSASGYTIAVVGYNGKAVFSRNRSFKLPAPDSKVTIQLINKRGVYAGPVVFAASATRAITGVKAGTNVGSIVIVSSKGYARLARKLAAKRLDASRWAYAKRGVPIGNGRNLGLVGSKSKGSARAAGHDPAHIGIPNEFNIALPGTRVLKALSPATRLMHEPMATAAAVCPPSPAAAPPGCTPPQPGGPQAAPVSPWMSQMFLGMDNTVNVDAAGVTQAQINSTLQANLNLKLLNIPSGGLIELGCNGLSFCSQGGTGQAQLEGLQGTNGGGTFNIVPFPSGSLDPANGFGELVGPAVPSGLLGNDANGSREFSLNPNATSAQIGSGDVITEFVTNNGSTTQTPTTIDFVFNTVPAITAYSDTGGNAGSISYPDTSGLGTQSNPLRVAAGPNGDVVLTFTVLRPQRPGVAGAGETSFMDIGHLGYEVDYAQAPTPGSNIIGSSQSPQCPTSSYSEPSSTLSAGTGAGGFGPPPGMGWLVDSAADQPASAANTISFSIDLTQCLASKGTSSFPAGQPVQFDLSANSQSSADHVNQSFTVQRTG
jgi:hypothetical protein